MSAPQVHETPVLEPETSIAENLYFVNIMTMFLNKLLRRCTPWTRARGHELDQESSFPYTGRRREP
jgi:hypothetical protein